MTFESSDLEQVKTRLQQAIEALNLDQAAFAVAGDIRKQTVTDYIKGKSLPGAKAMALWSQKFRLNINWLLTGEWEMLLGGGALGADDAALPTPVADAIRKAEIALRKAGASEQSVWVAVQSLARDRLES